MVPVAADIVCSSLHVLMFFEAIFIHFLPRKSIFLALMAHLGDFNTS